MLNQIRTILSVVIIMALLFGGGISFGEQPSAAADGGGLDLPPLELPEKGNPKLDSQLNQLASAETRGEAASFSEQRNIKLVDGNVRVIVECEPGQVDAATEAASALGVMETSYHDWLQVVVPISQLTAMADMPGTRFVRLPWYPLADVVSEGVGLINADEWQATGYDGTGVKVAILDSGFTGYSSLLGTELPASLTTQSFYADAGYNIEGYSAHGTACAEVVYDIAPDAQYYLVNFGTEVEMGNAVDWLIAQGVDFISYSFGWPVGGPGDGTGLICGMVDDARAAGILWSSAIGNYAQQHWQGDFNDPEPDGWHNFSGTDIYNDIVVNSGDTIKVGLKWDDTWGSSVNDYDLYLFDSSSPDPIAWSVNTQDGDDDPSEFLMYTATYTGDYYIVIDGYYATTTANFHLYSYRHNLQYQVASSSFGIPADSANAMAVGAVFWNNPTTLESFSSRGPTKDGRIKPDLVAPDGVSTATYGASDFYGTSASAPHVAGAAVLVKERYPSYTPAQIQAFLEGRAVELGAAGKDNLYGSGRLHLGSSGITVEVTTNNATNITTNSATANGYLNNLGTALTVLVSFQYGLTTAYGSVTTPQAMTTTGSFNFPLTGLSPNTTYHFRAKAVGNGTSYGLDKSFTTSQDGAATVSIVPSNQTVLACGSFNINVMVDSAGIPITACNVIVTFDTDLAATGLNGHDLLGTNGLYALYLPTIDVGEAGYAGVRIDGPIAVNGNFVTINFYVNPAASGTYPLVIDATLNDAFGNPIGVVENNGQVNIGTNGRKGDFDGDGDIDFFDFYQFCSAYGSELGDPAYNVIGDFDDNGDIGFLDFYSFCGVYGT